MIYFCYFNFINFYCKSLKKDKGIYASCKESNQAYKDLIELRCFYSNCNEKKSFESMAFLKKHLKEKH